MTSSTAKASILMCHDILATIFDFLAPGPIDLDNPDVEAEQVRRCCRDDLAKSALSCSIISYHALNVLWRELDNVHPLLKVLPNYEQSDPRPKLCGAILPAHWTRFQLYADRVRVILGRTRQPQDRIHPSVWPFLAAKSKGSPLMPRLRKLRACDLVVPTTSTLILLLLSPTLRVVDLSFELEFSDPDVAPEVVGSLLHTLPLMAPDLEDLTFDIDFHDGVNVDHGYLQSFGHHFTRLKTLSIICAIPLERTVLQLLSSIPTVQDLTCTIDILSSSEVNMGPSRCAFRQLARLDICGHLDHLVAFFDACQLPSLADITLRISRPSHAQDPADSLAVICQRCNPTLLTSFSVEVTHHYVGNSRPNSLMQYSEPLLAFPNITSFHFRFFYIVPPIRDDDLMRFGAAWPRLESFCASHLLAYYSLPDVARPTLPGVIALAQCCPRLDRFHVSELDVTDIPRKDGVPVAAHCLRHFTVNNIMPELPSRSYMEVAAILDRVFPDIDLEYARSESESDGPEWKDVLQFLEVMRVGRENSELRAKLRQGAVG